MLQSTLRFCSSGVKQLPLHLFRKVLFASAAGTLLMYVLTRLRLLPTFMMRAWFLLTAPGFVALGRIGAELVQAFGKLFRIPKRTREGLATVCFNSSLAMWMRINGQIQVPMDTASKQLWSSLAADNSKGHIVLMNHASVSDAVIISYHASYAIRSSVRVVYKSSIAGIPLIGPCFVLGGHFPVYFKNSTSFSVDERQAEVTEKMDEFLKTGGRLMLFPEGQVNKNPEQLQPFRIGTFKLILKHQLPVYFLTMSGSQDLWPTTASVGGFPCQIKMKFSQFDAKDYKETAEEMGERARKEMQHILNELRVH